MDATSQEDCTAAIAPIGLVSKQSQPIYRHFEAIYTFLGHLIVAKTTSGFNSDRIIRQHAHGLLLESPLVPSSTNRWDVWAKIRQKRPSWQP